MLLWVYENPMLTLKVSKFQNENTKSSHCPKYERKDLKNSALSIQGKIFQIFRSYFGQCDDFILSFWNLLTFSKFEFVRSYCISCSWHQTTNLLMSPIYDIFNKIFIYFFVNISLIHFLCTLFQALEFSSDLYIVTYLSDQICNSSLKYDLSIQVYYLCIVFQES